MTFFLIILTAITSYLGFEKKDVFDRYKFNAYLIYHKKDYKRLLTHGFLHADWIHLIFNMFVLFFFGQQIEEVFVSLFPMGRLLFVVFYLSAIMMASLVSLYKHKNNHYYNSIGASGGVASLVFAYILFGPLENLCLYGVLCLPGIIWGVAYLAYSYYQSKQNNDNYNHDAHFMGSLYGFLFPLLFEPKLFIHFIQQLIP